MEYALSGFALVAPSRPTFAVPFFSRRDTNQVFAQEMDAYYNIVAFLPFEPNRYVTFQARGAPIVRSVGQKGILALVDTKDRIKAGEKEDVADVLTAFDLKEEEPPFFAVEAAGLLGSQQLKLAQKRASKQFGNAAIGRQWLQRQRAVTRSKGRSAEAEFDYDLQEILERLRASPLDSDWQRMWQAAWKKSRSKKVLTGLAEWWLQLGQRRVGDEARLLMTLVTQKHWPDWLEEFAHNWLATHATLSPFDWPALWLAVTKRRGVTLQLAESAINYLAEAPQNDEHFTRGKRKITNWSAIWKRVWVKSEEPEAATLFELARMHVAQYPITAQVVQSVLLPLLRTPQSRKWAQVTLGKWLRDTPARTILWTKVYLELLEADPEDGALVELGLDFIGHGYPNLRTWPQVWRRLSDHLTPQQGWDLAISWLLRSDLKMNVWPDVLLQVLENGRIDHQAELRAVAIEWLRLDHRHEQRNRIESFADARQAAPAF